MSEIQPTSNQPILTQTAQVDAHPHVAPASGVHTRSGAGAQTGAGSQTGVGSQTGAKTLT